MGAMQELPVKTIIDAAGGAAAIAAATGVDRTTPYSWKRIPAAHARAVARLAQMPLSRVRPDLWPERPTRTSA
jgi:hypothetical protein